MQPTINFSNFFARLHTPDGERNPKPPHRWQEELALDPSIQNRLIRIPTGFGKTAGVVFAWLWNRVVRQDPTWPRRLVFCLPMRVLVEQTHREISEWLRRLAVLLPESPVQAHLLMGGHNTDAWHLQPEHNRILIGTQDMLLSRALNRGYAASRPRWPIELGLLSQDALWVLDEVQLMDVGLSTSAQLQQFRSEDSEAGRGFKPTFSWWMSATLQPSWLQSADTAGLMASLRQPLSIPPAEQQAGLWEVHKPLSVVPLAEPSRYAELTLQKHEQLPSGAHGKLTLLVVNTVEKALECFDALQKELQKQKKSSEVELRLVHSRYRGAERASWVSQFLHRSAGSPHTSRILVATQVIEAGVDISAGCLLTELAPWPSLVQRFGRAARFGGKAEVVVLNHAPKDDRQAAPYSRDALLAALEHACSTLQEVSPRSLEQFEAQLSAPLRKQLYPYAPTTILLRQEWWELFDTTPDLTGADIDVSRFIRSGDERDVQVFWREVEGKTPPENLQPSREELCPVPFLKAQEWLYGKDASLLKRKQAWIWDFLSGEWRSLRRNDIYPGRVILVSASSGGYLPERGFSLKSETAVPVVAPPNSPTKTVNTVNTVKTVNTVTTGAQSSVKQLSLLAPRASEPPPADLTAADLTASAPTAAAPTAADLTGFTQEPSAPLPQEQSQNDDPLSIHAFKTLATHSQEVVAEVQRLGEALALPAEIRHALELAARWHDVGKTHPAFQGSIRHAERPERHDLAKAPASAWNRTQHGQFWTGDPPWKGSEHTTRRLERRSGFRHELASALGIFAVLQQHQPDHPALVGKWQAVLKALDQKLPGSLSSTSSSGVAPGDPPPTPTALEKSLLALSPEQLDLVVYLVASHHGKVRMSLHATPDDQEFQARDTRGLPIRGVREGDELPALRLDPDTTDTLPPLRLSLTPAQVGLSPSTGRSWTERSTGLLKRLGPGALAYLEACLRTADIRASRLTTPDPMLMQQKEEAR
ncbi:MAG: DEAD/DEAH box helicase [Myxococcota bacterium]